MKYELSQRFFFDAAHTLGRAIETEPSKRIHGHTYQVEVSIEGVKDESTGMVVDLGLLRRDIAILRDALDHRLLDEVDGLGPPTLENLCLFIAKRLQTTATLQSIKVWRDSIGDSCALRLGTPRS
ncbi:6-pyruvoyl trahydropterin synthase family protein [Hydrogenophaga laconesensis]|uniref:6-carboxy-5,6,7,8-tetrahydropterin synthase n=1 Tax=Hydrogenophaga laconesensis TaxID=1805971 RepID=A0ABU1VGM8_9BURK|nr:6-carboxytetrahydropterin synthase [Hydrogenophaga laconesensis]MDR7096358.1 6-pyruvoyltetrahydropterin/6-carboxytetrahydropterin synthase [Hydrogenophaga laconesensis]